MMRTRALADVHLRKLSRTVVSKRGSAFLLGHRQRNPALYAMQMRQHLQVSARALRMHDAATGDHQVDRAGLNGLHHAETVAVHDLALEQIGNRRDADVRMRPHGDALAGRKGRRAHVIEEHEWPNHAALARG